MKILLIKVKKTRLKMLFRSKTAIKVRFKNYSIQKIHLKAFHNFFDFSAITTKLSNDYNAEQNYKILGF